MVIVEDNPNNPITRVNINCRSRLAYGAIDRTLYSLNKAYLYQGLHAPCFLNNFCVMEYSMPNITCMPHCIANCL